MSQPFCAPRIYIYQRVRFHNEGMSSLSFPAHIYMTAFLFRSGLPMLSVHLLHIHVGILTLHQLETSGHAAWWTQIFQKDVSKIFFFLLLTFNFGTLNTSLSPFWGRNFQFRFPVRPKCNYLGTFDIPTRDANLGQTIIICESGIGQYLIYSNWLKRSPGAVQIVHQSRPQFPVRELLKNGR